MWKDEVTIKTNASREQIWKIWCDVKNWNKWDKEVASSEIYGKFKTGAKGKMKPTNGPSAKFTILHSTPSEAFTTRSFLPLTSMDFVHLITEKDGQLYITHKVEISGLLTFLFSKIIGKKIIAELPAAMENLSQQAKNL